MNHHLRNPGNSPVIQTETRHFRMFRMLFLIALLAGFHDSFLHAAAPSPNEKDSHEWFLKEIRSKTDAILADFLKYYESHIKDNPEDVQAYIEQCKLIEGSSNDEDEDFGENQEQVDAFLETLLKKFPNDSRVVLYRASHLFGEEKVIYLEGHLRANGGTWSRAAVAEVLGTLAWHHFHNRQLDRAAGASQRAMTFDPVLDLSLIVAEHFETAGQRTNALAALRAKRDATNETWVIQRKAQLFCDLGSFQDALTVFKRLEAQEKRVFDNLRYAKALEECGEFESARQKLEAARASNFNKEAICRTIFLFDLEHGDGPTALSSYNALRDLGFSTDPLLRDRLALTLRHPGLGWTARDMAGLLALLVVGMAVAGLPALWIVPIHYVGLFRRQFKPMEPARPLHWNLGHFWLISSIYLCAVASILMIFHYSNLISAFSSELSSGLVDAKEYLIPSNLAFFLVMLVGTMLLLRRKDWALVVSSRWPLLKTLFYTGVLLVFLRMSARLLVGWLSESLDSPESFGAALLSIGAAPQFSEIAELFQAIYRDYGAGVLLVIAVMVVPFYEEFIFRGIILDSCERHISFHCANILQAVAFALMHQRPILIPFFIFFGLVAGLLRRESGGLLAPLLLHMGNNLLTTLRFISLS
jgi:membrane protease YdiL (CAAX protease family)/tetratricopeptide (TPR) repeat protein